MNENSSIYKYQNKDIIGNEVMKNTKNKYEKLYNTIIEKAKLENRKKENEIYENHHIIPRSLNGSDEKENLVLLTLREHFVCHKLLIKMYSGAEKSKMLTALFMMSNIRKFNLSSRVYEEVRLNCSNVLGKRKRSDETKKKLSEAKQNCIENQGTKFLGKGSIYIHNIETHEIKRVNSDFVFELPWKRGSGIKRSEETRMKMSLNSGKRKK